MTEIGGTIPSVNQKKILGKFDIYWSMKELSKILEKLYNTLGNSYLTENFDTEPFKFKVNVRKGDRDEDLTGYVVEVYSVPNLPATFRYKGNEKEGIHISVLRTKFKSFIPYIDSNFGRFGRTIGVRFMNVNPLQ
jgi:hypothetical protein